MRQVGTTLHRGARASHCRGLSCCRAQAPDAQAQQLWLMDLVAPRHVGSSQTRDRTRVPCIGRQILNHCATREAPLSNPGPPALGVQSLNHCATREVSLMSPSSASLFPLHPLGTHHMLVFLGPQVGQIYKKWSPPSFMGSHGNS